MSEPQVVGGRGAHAARELASQPSCWQRAAVQAVASADVLPVPGARVAVVGCGTSFHVSRAYAALREAAGHGETDAFPASEFPLHRRYDLVLAVTRSGTTTEVLDLVDTLAGATPTTVVTACAEAVGPRPVAVVDFGFAQEEAVVSTRFATSVLTLARVSTGGDVARACAEAERVLAAPLDIDEARYGRFVFLGQEWCVGLAEEAALKLREAAGLGAEAYPAMEYRHGHISAAGEGTLVWSFGPMPTGLADAVRATGADVRDEPLDPLVDLVQAQRLALALARREGRDADRPAHLAYSVVLGAGER